jgi:hypothetical protein
MKPTTYTDSTGKVWQTADLRPPADSYLIAPAPKFEYYSINDVEKYAGLWAHFETSYDQFIIYHCVKVEDYNKFIDAYMLESE